MIVVRFGEKPRELAMFCPFWKLKLLFTVLFIGTVHMMSGYVEIDRNGTVTRGSANDDFTVNLWWYGY
ncbi:hypothetical protein SLEP1_g12578 [Rubroshorea leprosula]|uniref:Uncharacterized protein n=1 Tax=Rubroshorea leprosula TaxID=152421 RepID=A0AAV5IJ07_9ROSI|nr:hypothetical protein SLEP1_g12578 [Rubroshorea leprosula]